MDVSQDTAGLNGEGSSRKKKQHPVQEKRRPSKRIIKKKLAKKVVPKDGSGCNGKKPVNCRNLWVVKGVIMLLVRTIPVFCCFLHVVDKVTNTLKTMLDYALMTLDFVTFGCLILTESCFYVILYFFIFGTTCFSP